MGFLAVSPHAFDVLFNRLTGFVIIESTAGLYGVILPLDSGMGHAADAAFPDTAGRVSPRAESQ
jgi:hypothetical protein